MATRSKGTWKRNEEILHSAVGEEIILMSIENNFYYGLDSIASRIWELLQEPLSLFDICKILQNEYEVDQTTCEKETFELLNSFRERNLVDYHES